jgi:LmbE family N-acetylglucosaminyl deacetylase
MTRRSGQTEIDPDADLIEEVGRRFAKRALCVFAHPDDLEFSSGGTVSRLCALGWEVDIVVTTSGNKGTKDPEVTGQSSRRARGGSACRRAGHGRERADLPRLPRRLRRTTTRRAGCS